MSEYACFLITLLFEESLMKVALKVKFSKLKGDTWEFPMEPENKEFLYSLLPEHVRECGPIVDVDTLFEVEVIN